MRPINILDLNNAQQDVTHIAEIATSAQATAIDRLGQRKRTISGVVADAALSAETKAGAAMAAIQGVITDATFAVEAAASASMASIGYQPPVAYGAGISITARTQTVSYAGQVFGPNLADIPFTTSGTFESTKFRLISGVTAADLAAASGAALVGNGGESVKESLDALQLPDYAALRAYKGPRKSVYVTGVLGTAAPSGIAGMFVRDDADTASADNGGTVIVANGKRFKRRYTGGASIEWFGADPTGGADSTAAIVAAIAAASRVFVPAGTFKTTANINIPSNKTISGANRSASVINGGDKSHAGFTFTGNTAEISDIFIRDMSVGVVGGSGRYCKVRNCVLSYNRIGIDWNSGYINSVHSNNITFNAYGMVVRGQSFALHIYDNVIDNNLGGCGLLVVGANGAVIRDNTIEGNRNDAVGNKRGVGLFIAGLNQRLVVSGNWLEQNGTGSATTACSDIIIGVPNVADVTDIVANCVPDEYKSLLSPGSVVTGTISLANNFYYATKHGIITPSGGPTCTISIEKETFVGVGGTFNKSIRIVGQGAGGKVRIAAPQVVNTAATPVNAEMNTGVLGSCVFFEGTAAMVNQVTLDGVDLFTKRMTASEFLSLPGATLTCTARVPSSGTASMLNTNRAAQGAAGVTTVAGTGRLRLGASGVLTTGSMFRAILIARVGSQGNFTYSGGGAAFPTCVGNNGRLFAVTLLGPPTSAEVTLSTGEYYGYCFLSEADYATHMNGALRIEITDLEIVTDKTVGAAPPVSALHNSSVGDVIYNSAPAAGGSIGWVCIAAGAPGTWKAFGTIAA